MDRDYAVLGAVGLTTDVVAKQVDQTLTLYDEMQRRANSKVHVWHSIGLQQRIFE